MWLAVMKGLPERHYENVVTHSSAFARGSRTVVSWTGAIVESDRPELLCGHPALRTRSFLSAGDT